MDHARTSKILNGYPVWVLVYHAREIRATFINESMANTLEVPPGFIDPRNEYLTVHHCDAATGLHRFKAFEHFNANQTIPLQNIATIFLPNKATLAFNDLASPIAFDSSGQVTYYAHFYSELNSLTLVNAYGLCDPDELSPRQKEVFAQLLTGIPLPKIAQNLNIAPKTLEKHTHAIFTFTGLPNQRALMEACSKY